MAEKIVHYACRDGSSKIYYSCGKMQPHSVGTDDKASVTCMVCRFYMPSFPDGTVVEPVLLPN